MSFNFFIIRILYGVHFPNILNNLICEIYLTHIPVDIFT